MKIKFIGVPGEKHDSLDMYGYTFPLDKDVEVSDATAIRKLANHPHFKADHAAITDVAFKEAKVYTKDTDAVVSTTKADAEKVASAESAAKASAANAAKIEKATKRPELEQLATAMGVAYDSKMTDAELKVKLQAAA